MTIQENRDNLTEPAANRPDAPVITEPGIYDLSEDAYHADPVPGGSLSAHGALRLLAPSCPAIFDFERRHPRPPTKAMELGTVVHGLVLGTGQPAAVLDFDDYRTAAAKDAREAAIAAGQVPLLAAEHARAAAVAAAVTAHPVAGAVFAEGTAEQSLFWTDPEYGIWKRARLDWIPSGYGRPLVAELKTCASASPLAVTKAVADFGYYLQAAWYREGLYALGGDLPDVLLVFVQTTEPYLVTVADLDPEALAAGAARARLASEIYRDCTAAGTWPAWSGDIIRIGLPAWAQRRIDNETGARDDDDPW